MKQSLKDTQHPVHAQKIKANVLPISEAIIQQAIDEEMAVTLEDVLARRTRCLFLDARATIGVASEIAFKLTGSLDDFQKLAEDYL